MADKDAGQVADSDKMSKESEVNKMERSKVIVSIFVGLAAVFIVWRVGFYPPVPEKVEKPAETAVVGELAKPVEALKPADVNEPKVVSDVKEPQELPDVNESARLAKVTEPVEPVEPNEPMEYVNLKDVQMKDIVQKLADWTGKVIIPSEEAMKQKVTVYAPNKLPRSKALAKIYSALRMKGYVAEHTDDTIYLTPIAEAKLGEVPTVMADYPLAMLENKDQVVQKFFKLRSYNPSQMGEIILPLIGEHGYVSADESTSSLLVIDTVANLMRIERIIEQFDVLEAEQTVTEIFEVHHGNPEEIVELLETLLSDGGGSLRRSSRGGRPSFGGGGPFGPRPSPESSTSSKKTSTKGGTATSITVGTTQAPVVLIPEPRHNWIIAKASPADIKLIGEWIEKLDKSVSTLLVDYPLSRIENKNQVVQKFFKLENYSPSQMGQVIEPLLTESGYVSADESTRSLLVIDTVENLMRIELIIEQFDVPEAEQTVTEIFKVLYSDPSEVVQLLRMLISGESGTSSSSRSLGRSSSYSRSSRSSSRYSSSSRPSFISSASYRGGDRSGSSSSVVVGTSQMPVVLIPEPKRKWIIARASAEDMKRIGEWIEKLDTKEPVEKEYETIPITYADVGEVADRLNEALQQMPGAELQASVLVQAMEQARQVVVFGREDMRDLVRKLIAEIDVPSGLFQTEHFRLKYADPDEIKEKLEELYAATSLSSGSRYTSIYYFGSSRGTSAMSPDTVKVISYVTLKQVTVIATAENMEKVRQQIAEWDAPINVEELKPRIIELRNSDPVQMAELLRALFSEETSRGMSIYDILFGTSTAAKQKIVGPLYGQLTFEEVPGTKKIIVISKIPEAYDVVEALILDLDRQEMAEVPRVVQLKYADPEDLSERLNAMFNEPGTSARIRVSARGLADYSMEEEEQTQGTQQSGGGTTSGAGGQSTEGTYTPWWSGSGARSRIDEEMPISNVIGKIRFVPDPHSKSILVLAPVGFIDRIEEMINELDVPGKQVMIKAVIVEVDHKSMTSLGLQLASDPTAFGTLGENAFTALNTLTHMATHGTIAPSAATTIGATGTGTVLGTGTDVFALIDFLIKKVNAKILNQQTLWTKDNEEASFFKGQRVAFQTQMGVTQQTTTQSYEYEKVGMTLAARPSITPEKNVDMVVNVLLSQLTSDQINNQPVRSLMETQTNMIVQDGQTIMLGGILFQTDSVIERKLPLLGDVPLAGGLFRHNEILLANNELIVFITPFVIDEPGEMLPETKAEIEGPRQKLEEVKEQLEQMRRGLEAEAPKEQQESQILEPEQEKAQNKREPSTKEHKKIDDELKQPEEEMGAIYSRSIDFYCDGQLEKAREGFVQVLNSDLAPAVVKETVEAYLIKIDSILAQRGLFAQASYSQKH